MILVADTKLIFLKKFLLLGTKQAYYLHRNSSSVINGFIVTAASDRKLLKVGYLLGEKSFKRPSMQPFVRLKSFENKCKKN